MTNWWTAILRLWARLTLLVAIAGLFGLLFYSLESIDMWIHYQTPGRIIIESAERWLVILGIAGISGAAGALFAAAILGWSVETFKRRGDAVFRWFAIFAIVLCSLVLWREIWVWFSAIGLFTFPFWPKYLVWLVGVAALIFFFRRRSEPASREIEAVLAGKATRRTVIATGLSALGVAAGSAAFQTPKPVSGGARRSALPLKPNFVLVTFDAMSAEDMSLYGYRLPTTPNIDAFAQNASVLTNYFSSSTWTTPSIASLMTGRYPLKTQVFHDLGSLRGEAAEKSVVRELRSAGYETAASVANLLVLPQRIGLDFDLVSPLALRGAFPTPPILRDDVALLQALVLHALDTQLPTRLSESRFPPEYSFEQAKQLIAAVRPPFFLWVHVMAPHTPYLPSPPFLHRFLHTTEIMTLDRNALLDLPGSRYSTERQPEIDKWRLRYNEWIAQADNAFGEFVAWLGETNYLDNTNFIVSADHGESFEGGVLGHGSGNQVRPIVHVPLIVRAPGQSQGQRVTITADHTALAPTILDLADLPIPEWIDGRTIKSSLRNGGQGSVGIAFTQFFDPRGTPSNFAGRGTVGAIADERQYILDIESGAGSLYRLTEAHLHHNDISETEPLVAQSMRSRILSRFPELRIGAGERATQT